MSARGFSHRDGPRLVAALVLAAIVIGPLGALGHATTTEMVSDPMWVKTRFGYWTSRDRLAWTRVATVRESSGEFEGKDPRASLWSPLPLWDPGDGRWSLFYVAHRSMPTDGTRFLDTARSSETCAVGFVELRLER